jgi:outer membrane protein
MAVLLATYEREAVPAETGGPVPGPLQGDGNARIVFINSDSLKANYQLFKDLKASLEQTYKVKEADIKARQKTYEKDAAYFQEQVNKKSLSEKSAQMIYEDLMKVQQQLIDLRDQYTEELSRSEYDMNLQILDSIDVFLKRYNQEYGYDYILGYSKGSGILYAKDTLDITGDVIRKLNESYSSGKDK